MEAGLFCVLNLAHCDGRKVLLLLLLCLRKKNGATGDGACCAHTTKEPAWCGVCAGQIK
jgi:hypothetical protein